MYCKVASTNPSCLESHAGFFGLSMKKNLMFIYCDLFTKSWFRYHKHALIHGDFTVIARTRQGQIPVSLYNLTPLITQCPSVCASSIFVMGSVTVGVSEQITTMGLHIMWGLVSMCIVCSSWIGTQEAKIFNLERS
jgi:hypothetical protein